MGRTPPNPPRRPADPSPGPASAPTPGPTWLFAAGLVLAVAGIAFEPALGRGQDGDDGDDRTRAVPSLASGGTSDSNNTMIAVTGVDVTGQSILYLVDTVGKQICVYQASGGSSSTQGIKFVGARRIELDLLLDGFNDKTESKGKSLSYKDLQRMFESTDGPTGDGR